MQTTIDFYKQNGFERIQALHARAQRRERLMDYAYKQICKIDRILIKIEKNRK